MRRYRTIGWSALAATLTMAASACGGDDQTDPVPPLTIEKAPSKSGDNQTGAPGEALSSPLKVLVTRDGNVAEQVNVAWTTPDGGSVGPSTPTDANGFASATWTLGPASGEQTARASVSGATNSPIVFTATAEDAGGPGTATVSVNNNSFSPSEISVQLGQTVTWVWAEGAQDHNVTPDVTEPSGEGPTLFDAPHTYTFTFNTPGTYRYFCSNHGGKGGIGMSGTVVVGSAAP